jgi:hypothetical protein
MWQHSHNSAHNAVQTKHMSIQKCLQMATRLYFVDNTDSEFRELFADKTDYTSKISPPINI